MYLIFESGQGSFCLWLKIRRISWLWVNISSFISNMQNTRRSASYSEKGPIKCRRNPFDLLFVLIMINIIHPKRGAGAFFSFFGNARFSDLAKFVDFQCIACVCSCSSATLLWPKVFCGRGRLFAPIESSSGIVRRIENLTKLLKIPHSQKARGLSRAGMILMVGIGQYWLIYIETKFSEWLLVWQCTVDQRCFKSPGEQISSKFGGCEFRPDQQIWSSWS